MSKDTPAEWRWAAGLARRAVIGTTVTLIALIVVHLLDLAGENGEWGHHVIGWVAGLLVLIVWLWRYAVRRGRER